MDLPLALLAAALLVTLLAGIGRALVGPQPADRILAAQLLGTAGVAVLLVLAAATDARALQDVALVLVLLAAMATIVWLRRIHGDRDRGPR
jgi:multicomponent Na+:H+ antiporter subunit F